MSSAFRINPENILGLQAKKQRNKLLAVALAKPENYYAFKEDVETKVISDSVKIFYDMFYNLLTNGIDPKGDQLKYYDANNNEQSWEPKLPESVVAKFSMKVAQVIEEITEEALEEALPSSITELAVNKQKKILDTKVENI